MSKEELSCERYFYAFFVVNVAALRHNCGADESTAV